MATLVCQNGIYSLQFYSADRTPARKRVPLRIRVKRDAEAVRRKLERDYALGQFDPWTSDPLTYDKQVVRPERLSEAVAAFLDSKSHKADRTVQDYRKTLNRFASHAGPGTLVGHLTARHVEDWLSSTDAGDVSRQTYTRTIKVFLRWSVRNGLAANVATEGVRLRKVPRKFPRFLTPDEVDRIVSTIKAEARTAHWLADLVVFAVHTGLRRGELVDLQWDAVDIEARVLTVANTESFTTKSGAERKVPLSDTTLTLLARRAKARGVFPYVFTTRSGRLTPCYLSHAFLKYARRAGVDGCHLHHLRHTACSWLAQRGVPVEAIRRFAGHSSITVTEKYMHVGDDLYDVAIRSALSPR